MAKKFIVACGGTGGHAFPGLAVAQELRTRGHDVVVWNAGRSIEGAVMKAWDGAVFTTRARPLHPKYLFANVFAWLRCRREMKRFAPDALLAMGSYASLPPVIAASGRGVPVVLHEANTIPGRAVDFLSRFARTVAITFPETADCLKGRTVKLTGLPVRREVVGQTRFEDVPTDAFCLFVTGGSQGAHRVNELTSAAMALVQTELARRKTGRKLFVIHQTGAADCEMVAKRYADTGIPCRVQAFEQEMGRAFATADLVVARAGASTCFELALVGRPAFFIPLPTALRDHQHFNALSFVKAGAADEGVQDALTPRALANYVLHKIDHPDELARKARAMKKLATPDAAARVTDLLEEAVR